MKAVFCKTKTGNGYKILVGETWLYTSKENVLAVVREETKSCQFQTIENSDSENESEDSSPKGFVSPFEGSSNDEPLAFEDYPLTHHPSVFADFPLTN